MAQRVPLIEPDEAEGLTKLLFESALQLKSGRLPNSYKIGAHAPFTQMMLIPFIAVAALENSGGVLSTKLKEMAVIKTSHVNGCAY